jgi:hypothetical protein
VVAWNNSSRCGWTLVAPGRWHRGDEVILRRSPGVWHWFPDGLSSKRKVGPFKSMRGARLCALRRGNRSEIR